MFELLSVPGNILGLFQEDLSQFWLNLKNKMIFFRRRLFLDSTTCKWSVCKGT
jgi:hypothetical protein